jgi:hypothetical protein
MGGPSGGGQAPQTITPGQAAQAALGTQAAGEQMAVANQPVDQYGNLYTTTQLGPAMTRTQQALANQAAYQSAAAQQDIQSRLDPQAYAQRQMRMAAANRRLGQLTSQDPAAFSFRAPSAYNVADMSSVAPLSALTGAGQQIAGNLSVGSVSKTGTNPTLIKAKATDPTLLASTSYF